METVPLVSEALLTKKTNPRIAIVVGGDMGIQKRGAVQAGQSPRIDVLELERQHQARMFDFTWLEETSHTDTLSRLFSNLARWIGWSAALAARISFEHRHFEVIYVTGEDIGIPLAWILRLFRRKTPRVIMRLEQLAYGRTPLRRRIYTFLFRFGVQRIDLILCRTHAHAAYLQNVLNVPKEHLRFVSEPVDTAFFSPAASATPKASLEGIRKPYIFSAGLEMRDYETLIQAVRGLEVSLVIAAGSPWSHFTFASGKADLPENVLVSSFSRVEMRELYRQAEFVVVSVKPTNRSCGISVILETWAMKKPLVATKTIGLAEYVEDSITGRLVEPENIQAMRQAIVELLENPALSVRFAENGHHHVVQDLRLDQFVFTVGALLSELASRSAKNHH